MPSDETPTLDPATLALARLGAGLLAVRKLRTVHPRSARRGRLEQRKALFDAAEATPGILERVAELLHDTEARERREDEGNA
jgi:hypothetical protein